MTEIRVTVTNDSDANGIAFTPFWVGFHDGAFDLFATGETASAGLEQIAEDGEFQLIGPELLAADEDAIGGIIPGDAGPIVPGETTSAIFDIDGTLAGSVSLAAMVLPSNDAFVGTDDALTLFDTDGEFVRPITIRFTGADVYDAGTEVNTELDAAFINQAGPNEGFTENGVVELHPGFNGSAGNSEGEGDQIILGGTNAFGDLIDETAADFTLPGFEAATVRFGEVVRFEGSDDADSFRGGREDDIADLQAGDDRARGRSGFDELLGGEGNDDLAGNGGNDILAGGAGNDVLRGGRGADEFLYDGGEDEIIDFRANQGDRITIEIEGVESFEDLLAAAGETGPNVEFAFAEGDTLTLNRTSIDDLVQSDFTIVTA